MFKRDIQGKFALKNDDYRQVRSVRLGSSNTIRGQQQRINSAQTALNKLAAKPGEDPQQLAHKVESILERYRVKNFFSTRITEQIIRTDSSC